MNPKRIIIVGTMAIAITISAGMFGNDASAHTLSISIDKSGNHDKANENTLTADMNKSPTDPITQMLGLASDEELYEALYTGSSLADIAENNQVPVQHIIDLQVAELTMQLDSRLANGSISPATYQLQKSELPEIITNSIFVRMTP
ncbi:MAG: hypothetical protein WD469_02055 [Paenibacillaceae bacterium]